MLSRQEYFKLMQIGVNSDGTPAYDCNKAVRNDLYKEYVKEEIMNSDCIDIPCKNTTYNTIAQYVSPSHSHSLGTVECVPYDYGNQEKGNNPMNYATATVQAGTTETQDQRKYLTQRLENIFYALREPLYAQFGLSDDRPPSTPKELKQRIADGKFIIKGIKDADDEDMDDDDFFYGSWPNLIRWRDPAVKADSEGYEAATKELNDLRQKTLDIIKIDEPKAGLDAIKALEAWTPTGAAN